MIVVAKSDDNTGPTRHRVVRCPSCGGDSVYALSNPARPFCSERCQNMDFGAWASESFRVSAPAATEDLDTGDNPMQ